MEENLKKTDNTVTSEGKDDEQILINCIKNCAFYQSSVGAKEARFREIGKEKLELSTEKEKLMQISMIYVEKLQYWIKNLQILIVMNSGRCRI